MYICTNAYVLFQLMAFESCDEFVLTRVIVILYFISLILVHTLNSSIAQVLIMFCLYLAAVETDGWNVG